MLSVVILLMNCRISSCCWSTSQRTTSMGLGTDSCCIRDDLSILKVVVVVIWLLFSILGIAVVVVFLSFVREVSVEENIILVGVGVLKIERFSGLLTIASDTGTTFMTSTTWYLLTTRRRGQPKKGSLTTINSVYHGTIVMFVYCLRVIVD